jgi:hypothetical protein
MSWKKYYRLKASSEEAWIISLRAGLGLRY